MCMCSINITIAYNRPHIYIYIYETCGNVSNTNNPSEYCIVYIGNGMSLINHFYTSVDIGCSSSNEQSELCI